MEITFAKGIIKRILQDKVKEKAGIDMVADFDHIEIETKGRYVILKVSGECAIKKEDILNL